MTIQNILLLRHEISLCIAGLIILAAEVFSNDSKKQFITPMSIILLAIVFVIGLTNTTEGSLFGGMYNTDPIRSVVKAILDLGTLIILIQSVGWLRKEESKDKITEYFILIFFTLLGMSLMVSAGDFLMMYLGLELATIPVAALAAFDRHKSKSGEAGIKMIFSSALSTGVLLYGLSMIYGSTGSIYFPEVRAAFTLTPLSLIGLVFFVVGMGFKISLVPFHLWTADVYEGAPIGVTSFLSVISKGAATFTFMFVLYQVFGAHPEIWHKLLYLLAILTMTIGNLFALRQENMKRFLAFSSIAQAGFIMLGVLGSSSVGMGTVVFFMLIYVFTNLGAFGVVAAIYNKTGKENMSDYNGLYTTNPKLTFTLMLSLFSLAGIPPVAGFFGKLFLFSSVASQGYYILLLIAVLNATVSLYYYLRPIRAMFIEKNETAIPWFKSDNYMRTGLVICMIGLVLTGFISAIYEYIVSVSIGI